MKCNLDCFNCLFPDCFNDVQDQREYKKAYYLKHREEMIARAKKWNAEHPEQCREKNRKYYQKNREILLQRDRKAYMHQYYLAHKEVTQ